MNRNHSILIFTAIAVFAASSCARKEPPAAAELEQPAAVPTAPEPPPEPVRESAWKQAPVRAAARKTVQPPARAAAPSAPAAPATQPATRYDAAPAAPVASAPARVAPTPPPPPMRVTLASGSILAVRVGESLSSEKNQNGDSWTGVLAEPLVIDGLVIADRGARVQGRVTDATRAGRVKGVANLSVALTGFSTADGQNIDVQTASFTAVGKDETKKDAVKVGIASGIGAAIGAIAGRGKGAAIGAGAGAAAGTGVVLATRGGPAVIATEALIRFRTSEPVTITEKRK